VLDRLTLDQLRVLIAIADTSSFSAAARQLGRVHSAISQAVQSLEATLGTTLFDRSGRTPKLTDAGRIIVEDARRVVLGAETLRARAESIASEIEPELALAVSGAFPHAGLMASLQAFARAFPQVPVTLFTEGLSVPETRLREGVARLAIYSPQATRAADLEMEFLASIPMVAVVASDHPLASEPGPLTSEVLERHVQLAITDRTHIAPGSHGTIASLRSWRFGDLSTRLEYLLAGFGWCNMPLHLAESHIAAGRIKRLDLIEYSGGIFSLPLYAVHQRGRSPGRAGRWFIEDLRQRLRAGAAGEAMAEADSALRDSALR
jgi:DNA-binding transcriptional LysR family regulator